MSKSYFPTDRTGRSGWYDNFGKQFPTVGRELGFTDTEITNAVNDAKYAAHILNTLGPDIDADPGHVVPPSPMGSKAALKSVSGDSHDAPMTLM